MMSNTNPSPSLVDINDHATYLKVRVSLMYEIFVLVAETPKSTLFSGSAWMGLVFLARSVVDDAEYLEEASEALLKKEKKEEKKP